jgi:hypothetical protein
MLWEDEAGAGPTGGRVVGGQMRMGGTFAKVVVDMDIWYICCLSSQGSSVNLSLASEFFKIEYIWRNHAIFIGLSIML